MFCNQHAPFIYNFIFTFGSSDTAQPDTLKYSVVGVVIVLPSCNVSDNNIPLYPDFIYIVFSCESIVFPDLSTCSTFILCVPSCKFSIFIFALKPAFFVVAVPPYGADILSTSVLEYLLTFSDFSTLSTYIFIFAFDSVDIAQPATVMFF